MFKIEINNEKEFLENFVWQEDRIKPVVITIRKWKEYLFIFSPVIKFFGTSGLVSYNSIVDWQPTKSSVLCSAHFHPSCFEQRLHLNLRET
jgi:hypothetical protein